MCVALRRRNVVSATRCRNPLPGERRHAMAKGQIKRAQTNKPKLTVKEKAKKKQEKRDKKG